MALLSEQNHSLGPPFEVSNAKQVSKLMTLEPRKANEAGEAQSRLSDQARGCRSKPGRLASSSKNKVVAPLASFDCSITESLGEDKRKAVVEVPTLTGCFDYDELSDMVDDSLLEISNLGCLSKSIRVCERKPREAVGQQDGTTSRPINSSRQQQLNSQIAILVKHSPYDYSSTLRTPSGAQAASQTPNTLRLKCRSSRHPTSARSTRRTLDSAHDGEGRVKIGEVPKRKAKINPNMDRSFSTGCPVCAATSGLESSKKGKKKFGFSLFNFFGSEKLPKSSPCLKHQLDQSIPAETIKFAHNKSRSHPSMNSHDFNKQGKGEIGEVLVPVKVNRTRDSIRLTNQRKRQRANKQFAADQNPDKANPSGSRKDYIRSSNSLSDFRPAEDQPETQLTQDECKKTHVNTSEILLDLSREDRVRGLSSTSDKTLDDLDTSRQTVARQTKTVKFTTLPDRVVMVSPANNIRSHNPHHYHYTHTSRHQRAYPTSKVSTSVCASEPSKPSASQVLPAPIMKRPASQKLSSYSQTESSSNLNELLAKYDADSELVTAINERLKLSVF